jgi:hypothetical protein
MPEAASKAGYENKSSQVPSVGETTALDAPETKCELKAVGTSVPETR